MTPAERRACNLPGGDNLTLVGPAIGAWTEGVAVLKVDAARFDEQNALKLMRGES